MKCLARIDNKMITKLMPEECRVLRFFFETGIHHRAPQFFRNRKTFTELLFKTRFSYKLRNIIAIFNSEILPFPIVYHAMALKIAECAVVSNDLPLIMQLFKRTARLVSAIHTAADVQGKCFLLFLCRPRSHFALQLLFRKFARFKK